MQTGALLLQGLFVALRHHGPLSNSLYDTISDRSARPTLTVVWHFWTTRECLSIPYQPLLPEEVCCMIDCALPARCASCAISHSNSRVLRH
ncbi:hypothetical protein EV401DRAFT_2047753 [Pisolithus croceorrhizus]|nr:hypothetical protein EV401DRAFT_2047753 [Pisolithus croceorrhizus]